MAKDNLVNNFKEYHHYKQCNENSRFNQNVLNKVKIFYCNRISITKDLTNLMPMQQYNF